MVHSVSGKHGVLKCQDIDAYASMYHKVHAHTHARTHAHMHAYINTYDNVDENMMMKPRLFLLLPLQSGVVDHFH